MVVGEQGIAQEGTTNHRKRSKLGQSEMVTDIPANRRDTRTSFLERLRRLSTSGLYRLSAMQTTHRKQVQEVNSKSSLSFKVLRDKLKLIKSLETSVQETVLCESLE